MKNLLMSCALLLCFSNLSFAQVQKSIESLNKLEQRQQRRVIKKAFKKLYKKIKDNPELMDEFSSIISNCGEYDQICQDRLEKATKEATEGSALEAKAGGLTFGICHAGENFNKFHRLVYSKKNYDCKLSSHGKVYDRGIERKLYGPGLFWDKQSIVLMCTGPAYGKKVYGSTLAAGVGYGISLGSLFGDVGVCLAVGAGKSIGVFLGGASIKFEDLDKDEEL